jgi:hypothetical protein
MWTKMATSGRRKEGNRLTVHPSDLVSWPFIGGVFESSIETSGFRARAELAAILASRRWKSFHRARGRKLTAFFELGSAIYA